MTRRLLMVSPHFPPDGSAGAHRARLLAPHLPDHGWEPTVVTVDPRDYETRLDPELAAMVPSSLRVIRCRAWPARWTRRVGIGDLGLRAFRGLYGACSALLREEAFDALFITIYPAYPAMLGPVLKRRFHVPFVLDYQDPWVGSWGRTVGGGPGGRADRRSRLSRWLAARLEPVAVRAADAITAVSAETYEAMWSRNPDLPRPACLTLPIGGEEADFAHVRAGDRRNPYFDPSDGNVHICGVGTLLPLGFETLRAVLRALAEVREHRPHLYERIRLHFFGTSNETRADAPARVRPVADALGVGDHVHEVAPRIAYSDAIAVQAQATALLLMGSTEHHYTASKLYPGFLAARPLVAVYHEASSVCEILRRAARPPSVRLIAYDDRARAESRVDDIAAALSAVAEDPSYDARAVDLEVLAGYSAHALAGRLAKLLDDVAGPRLP
ncbi:MAG TPA: glycosyltransferase [Candidatus Bathyarchaeia archaeon]|nr:glycosyltransferase [Candidatus Bathyarchaeia archaeon]